MIYLGQLSLLSLRGR